MRRYATLVDRLYPRRLAFQELRDSVDRIGVREIPEVLENGQKGSKKDEDELSQSCVRIRYFHNDHAISSTGFAIGDGSLLCTAIHPIHQFARLNSTGQVSIMHEGREVEVDKVESGIQQNDIMILRLKERLPPLPVTPYPPAVTSHLKVFNGGWDQSHVRGYQDSRFADAKTGTYDDLETLLFELPAKGLHDGSSGGPILDASNAVVGVIRGVERGQSFKARGFATPAEKIWWMFKLL